MKKAFNCPHCNAFAKQHWEKLDTTIDWYYYAVGKVALCDSCDKFTAWVNKLMIYPIVDGVRNPHNEMPADIKIDYEEARSVASRSPRSAAALLRLSIEKLTNLLLRDKKGRDLNHNIAILVDRGLPVKIQKALDSLRVIGNHAVHPLGKIDLRDNKQIANSLFDILNMIVDDMISEPNRIDNIYKTLPAKDRSIIKKRDSKKPNK